jgi:hypothetical protein
MVGRTLRMQFCTRQEYCGLRVRLCMAQTPFLKAQPRFSIRESALPAALNTVSLQGLTLVESIVSNQYLSPGRKPLI